MAAVGRSYSTFHHLPACLCRFMVSGRDNKVYTAGKGSILIVLPYVCYTVLRKVLSNMDERPAIHVAKKAAVRCPGHLREQN